MKWLGRIVLGVGALYLLLLGGVTLLMLQPPERFGRIMKHLPMPVIWALVPGPRIWLWARAGDLQVGDPAPDFTLARHDHTGHVTLSSHRGRPVVLVFGSYTWPPFRRAAPALNELYRTYRDRAEFYVVYIQEAHPTDAWQMEVNVRENVLVQSTRSLDERIEVAGACVRNLGLEMPAIVDDADDKVERAYTGWPDRLYVIDREGRVAYKSDAGPFGFEPAEVKTTLEHLLPSAARSSQPSRRDRSPSG